MARTRARAVGNASKRDKRERISAAMRRISMQFPDTPEARLMLAIIDQAGRDLLENTHRSEAKRYLNNAVHAELCGVDRVWVKETFENLVCFDD